MKKLLLFSLLATAGLTQACKMNFMNDLGTMVVIALDEDLGENRNASDMLDLSRKVPPRVKPINTGLSITTGPNGDRNWVIYALENQVFVKKCTLSMTACMAETDAAAHNIFISDILNNKVDHNYLKVTFPATKERERKACR